MLNEISVTGNDSSVPSSARSNGGSGAVGASRTDSGGSDKPVAGRFNGGTAAARAILDRGGNTGRAKPTAAGEETESLGRPPVAPVKGKPEPPVKLPKLDLQTFCNSITVGLFGLTAVATGHEHWLKEHEEVTDFTGPLVSWINQLPPKTIKKLENNLAPAMAIGGLFGLVAPDIAQELQLRRAERASNRPNEAAQASANTNRNKSKAAGTSGLASGGSRGEGSELHVSIPTIPPNHPVNDTFDV